jgi:twitching motility protein PilT
MQTDTVLESALRAVIAHGGTDVMLTVGSHPIVRIDQSLVLDTDLAVIDDEMMNRILAVLLDGEHRAQLEIDRDVDFSFSLGDARFRGNAFFQRGTAAVALRLMHSRIPSMTELGLPPAVQDMTHLHQGLVLFTGPTGSGKSTSMAAMVDSINASRPCHIITIEDPIEYLHENRRAVVHQRQVGIDAPSFERALRSSLREDPDVILVGEMRDLESIAIALTLAETGHLVLSSLHTNDAAQAVDRIVDVFPTDRQAQIRLQLASVLSGVVAQRLVPRVGGGLVAAFEVLIATPGVSNLIREGKTRQIRNAMQLAMAVGNQTLEMSLNGLLRGGAITADTAHATAFVPEDIESPQPA